MYKGYLLNLLDINKKHRKIYIKPIVVESKGTVEQYPDYDDECGNEIKLRIIDELKVIDILNELDNNFIIEEYQSLFNYQRTITGKTPSKMREEIAEEVLTCPEHLTLFLPNQLLEHLDAMIHKENIFRVQDRYGLMKLNSYGFCQIKEDEYGFMIEIPLQIINVYKTHMTNTANKKIINKNAELQNITEYLLSKYGIIELDNLFKILCFITNRKIEYTNFIFFINSRFYYFGDYII